jgi:mannonate dehydratase
MEQTWRWFGPEDYIQLAAVRQAGESGIVTALHQIPYGIIWSVPEIEARKAEIAADSSLGLRWSVVESLPCTNPSNWGKAIWILCLTVTGSRFETWQAAA